MADPISFNKKVAPNMADPISFNKKKKKTHVALNPISIEYLVAEI